MILCLDCGNTSIKFALVENDKIFKSYLIRTIRERSSDEYAYSLSTLIGKEFVSRITNDKVLKQGETLDLVFNLDRIHIFDDYSNKCIF